MARSIGSWGADARLVPRREPPAHPQSQSATACRHVQLSDTRRQNKFVFVSWRVRQTSGGFEWRRRTARPGRTPAPRPPPVPEPRAPPPLVAGPVVNNDIATVLRRMPARWQRSWRLTEASRCLLTSSTSDAAAASLTALRAASSARCSEGSAARAAASSSDACQAQAHNPSANPPLAGVSSRECFYCVCVHVPGLPRARRRWRRRQHPPPRSEPAPPATPTTRL